MSNNKNMQTLQGDDDWVDIFQVMYDPVEVRYDKLNPMYEFSRSLYYTWLGACVSTMIAQAYVLAPRYRNFALLADLLLQPS